jgi:hypothetical protein
MNATDRRLLADIHTGLPSTFYDVPVLIEHDPRVARDLELAGSAHTKARLDASDLPDDARTLIDAVPVLLADIAELEASLDASREATDQQRTKIDRLRSALRDIARRPEDVLSVRMILRDAGFESGR